MNGIIVDSIEWIGENPLSHQSTDLIEYVFLHVLVTSGLQTPDKWHDSRRGNSRRKHPVNLGYNFCSTRLLASQSYWDSKGWWRPWNPIKSVCVKRCNVSFMPKLRLCGTWFGGLQISTQGKEIISWTFFSRSSWVIESYHVSASLFLVWRCFC